MLELSSLLIASALGFTAPEQLKHELPQEKPTPIILRKVVKVSPAEVRANEIRTTDSQESGGAGYILPGTNCVACVQQLTGRAQQGAAGSHVPTHSVPKVGSIMVWYPGEQGASALGHVAVVVGINGNSVNVAHCNWGGGQTTFQSTGKFY